jgi:hypothetical protein
MMRHDSGYDLGFETVRALQQQMRDERARDRVARQARTGTAFPGRIVLLLRRSVRLLPVLISKVVSRGRPASVVVHRVGWTGQQPGSGTAA